VKTVVDLRLIDEAHTSGLRFRCDDCAHFDERTERCGHAYPVTEHRPGPLLPGIVIVFCKDFELGGLDGAS